LAEAFFLDFWLPFLFIFARVVAFVMAIPIFSWRGVPVMLRVFFAFVLAALLTISWEGELELPATDLGLIFMLSREVFAGLLLGFLVYLFLSTFLMAGQFMDHKAGLMMAGYFDPLFGGQVTLVGQFFYLLAVVCYLTMNGHHMLFLSFRESLVAIPPGGPFASAPLVWNYVKSFATVFTLAFQIAAPVVIVLWMLDIALGFLSKTVPQIHVFIVGLPLKVAFVLLIFMLLLPLFGGVFRDVFDMLSRDLVVIMQHWH